MPEERIDFEHITQIYRQERSKKSLVSLPKNFFRNMREYINKLQKNCEEEEKRSMHSPKSIMLRDELKKAIKKSDEIWKIRMRKLVTSASSKLMGASIDKSAFTNEELEIFEKVVKVLEEGTNEIYMLEKLEEGEKEEKGIKEEKGEEEVLKAIEPSPKPEVKQEPRKELKDDVVVHILEDLPPMAGKDENYLLKKNDVVTLPKEIASVLVKKKKAKRIEVAI